MTRIWLTVVAATLLAGPAGAAVSPDPKSLVVSGDDLARSRSLVQKLGSEFFREREKAQKELAAMGRLARAALVEAVNASPSAEVRSRAAALLPAAEAADLQARVDTFLADADGAYEHNLPGWSLLRKSVGEKSERGLSPARDMYVAMLKNKPTLDLLVALGKGPEEAGKAVADRRVGLYMQINPGIMRGQFGVAVPLRPVPPSLPEIAGLLLAETHLDSKYIPRTSAFVFVTGSTFVQQAVSVNAINNPGGTPHAEVYRQLMIKWLDTRTAPEDLNGLAWVASNMKQVKETGPLLRRIVTTDGVQGWAKGQALMFLVQRSGKEEVPFVKTLLKNDALVTTVWLGNNPQGGVNQAPCHLRDVALAMLITMTGQQMKDYGFDLSPNFVPTQANIGYGNYAFTSDEKRDAAFKKWAAWEADPKNQAKLKPEK